VIEVHASEEDQDVRGWALCHRKGDEGDKSCQRHDARHVGPLTDCEANEKKSDGRVEISTGAPDELSRARHSTAFNTLVRV
jgi:hypothetical protein